MEPFDFRDYVDTEFFHDHREQLEHAFTELSKIPEFQQKLKEIKKAFNGQKIMISDTDFATNTAQLGVIPYITLDFEDMRKWRQFSPDTGKYEPTSLQNVIVHETYHLSDPKFQKLMKQTFPERQAEARRDYHRQFIGRVGNLSQDDIAQAVNDDLRQYSNKAAEPATRGWFAQKGLSTEGLAVGDMIDKMRKEDPKSFENLAKKLNDAMETDPALSSLKERQDVLHHYDAALEKERMKGEYRAVEYTNRIVAGPDSYFGEPRRGKYEDAKEFPPQPVLDHSTITQHREKLLPVGESNFHVCEEAVRMGREDDEFSNLRTTDGWITHYNGLSEEQRQVFNRARSLLHEDLPEGPLKHFDVFRARTLCEDVTQQRGR